MQTPDGAWRVEIVKRGMTRWYRIEHEDSLLDWLSIGSVQRILVDAGVDLADLVEVGLEQDRPVDNQKHGAA